MKKLTIGYTETTLNGLTLNQITVMNNEFVKAVDADGKTTKRFGTKPAAIKKCLASQKAYVESWAFKSPTKAEVETIKSKTIGKYQLDTMFELGKEPKDGTAMSLITSPFTKIDGKEQVTAKEIINVFVGCYEQKRGKAIVDDSYARGYLTGALRAGHVKIVGA